MNKPRDPQNCWEYWSCPGTDKAKCPVYQNDYGKRCWFLSGCAAIAERKFKNCWECPWYILTTIGEANRNN